MGSGNHAVVVFLLLLGVLSKSFSQSIIRMPEGRRSAAGDNFISDGLDDGVYCDSWRLSVETNNAGSWYQIPSRCLEYVKEYMTGDRYASDLAVASDDSLRFVTELNVSVDGKDAWVFDIDETLLSNLPYYQVHGFGSEVFDEVSFNIWADLAKAPALPASMKLYEELQKKGVTIFLLTGRVEYQRNATVQNLASAGYSNWERLILRGPSDHGKPAVVYKSEKRKEIEDAGYTIRGSSGDQWSDLFGFAVATRSFKLPNPMYYIA